MGLLHPSGLPRITGTLREPENTFWILALGSVSVWYYGISKIHRDGDLMDLKFHILIPGFVFSRKKKRQVQGFDGQESGKWRAKTIQNNMTFSYLQLKLYTVSQINSWEHKTHIPCRRSGRVKIFNFHALWIVHPKTASWIATVHIFQKLNETAGFEETFIQLFCPFKHLVCKNEG